MGSSKIFGRNTFIYSISTSLAGSLPASLSSSQATAREDKVEIDASFREPSRHTRHAQDVQECKAHSTRHSYRSRQTSIFGSSKVSAALHYLCTSLNPPNPFLDTELWLQFFDLAPTGNAAEMINERANLEARIKNHFTSIDGIVDTARMAMSKKSAQLIKDTTTKG